MMPAIRIGLICILVAAATGAQAGDAKYILVDGRKAGRLVYVIDKKHVPSDNLSDYFSSNRATWNRRSTDVKVILKQDASFRDFLYARATLQKIGFLRVTFFVKSDQTDRMVQIDTLGPTQPAPAE